MASPQQAPATDENAAEPKSGKEHHEAPAEPESHGSRLRWQQLPMNVLRDEKAIWTSPFRAKPADVKYWLLFGGAAAALIATDHRTSNGLPNTSQQLAVSKWTSRLGADYSIFPITASFYLAGKLGDNPRARDASRIGIEALADAEITVNIIKVATRRARPTERDGHGHFWDGGDGFPSGHSIKAWALARVISREFPHPRIIPVVAYGLASTVSISRFAGRRHFASDALVGAAMGWFIGDYVYRHHHAPSKKSKVAGWFASHVGAN